MCKFFYKQKKKSIRVDSLKRVLCVLCGEKKEKKSREREGDIKTSIHVRLTMSYEFEKKTVSSSSSSVITTTRKRQKYQKKERKKDQ